jgi:plasmid maintenance system antidote protein VapI
MSLMKKIKKRLKKSVKRIQSVAKKVEHVGKRVAQKTMPSSVRHGLSKVVRNPVFQTVALTVATAGVGALAQGLGRQAITSTLLKNAAISGVKKAAVSAAVKGVAKEVVKNKIESSAKQIAQNTPNYVTAGKVINTAGAVAQPIAATISAQGGNAQQAWINSQAYKDTVLTANNAAMRAQVKSALMAQGVPANQLEAATDAAILQLSNNAISEKKDSLGLGTVALVAVPILFAMMGG